MGMDPALVVGGESAGGDDTVDMGMEQEVGTPAVQDGEEADLGTDRTMGNLKSLVDLKFNEDDITILLLKRGSASGVGV
jgi:hypothetical protein